MNKMIFYLDECFNTGNNWLDNNQPYFTYGGWLIEEINEEKARSIIRAFFSKHQGDELKSKSFSSGKGIQEVIGLSEELIDKCGARPRFICMDKKYMIACKVVEAFFDHKYNKNVNGYLTFPNEKEYLRIILGTNNKDIITHRYNNFRHMLPPINDTKKGLAEYIYCDKDLCKKVGYIINDKSNEENEIDTIITEMRTLFKNEGLYDVCTALKRNNINKSKILEELRPYEDDINLNPRKILFLVKPCIFEMVSNLKAEYENLELVVDSLGESNFLFKDIGQILNVTIEIKDSKQDELIMASDLFVGHIARITKDIVNDSITVPDAHLRLIKDIFVAKTDLFKFQSKTMWFYKFPLTNWKLLCNKMLFNVKEIDYQETLKNKFKYFLKDHN